MSKEVARLLTGYIAVDGVQELKSIVVLAAILIGNPPRIPVI